MGVSGSLPDLPDSTQAAADSGAEGAAKAAGAARALDVSRHRLFCLELGGGSGPALLPVRFGIEESVWN